VGEVADSSHDRLLRSGLVGERVVFVGNHPAVAVPPQSDCQPEPVAGVALELLRRAAAHQSVVRDGHRLSGRGYFHQTGEGAAGVRFGFGPYR
jgi:hypothetical protein